MTDNDKLILARIDELIAVRSELYREKLKKASELNISDGYHTSLEDVNQKIEGVLEDIEEEKKNLSEKFTEEAKNKEEEDRELKEFTDNILGKDLAAKHVKNANIAIAKHANDAAESLSLLNLKKAEMRVNFLTELKDAMMSGDQTMLDSVKAKFGIDESIMNDYLAKGVENVSELLESQMKAEDVAKMGKPSFSDILTLLMKDDQFKEKVMLKLKAPLKEQQDHQRIINARIKSFDISIMKSAKKVNKFLALAASFKHSESIIFKFKNDILPLGKDSEEHLSLIKDYPVGEYVRRYIEIASKTETEDEATILQEKTSLMTEIHTLLVQVRVILVTYYNQVLCKSLVSSKYRNFFADLYLNEKLTKERIIFMSAVKEMMEEYNK